MYNRLRGTENNAALIFQCNYHYFIVRLLNEVHDGTAVWLTLMVSPWSLYVIKQPHQPILSSRPYYHPASPSNNSQWNRVKPSDGLKPSSEG